MTTGAKVGIVIGLAVTITVAVVLYKTLNKTAGGDKEKEAILLDIYDLTAKKQQGGQLTSQQRQNLDAGLSKAKIAELLDLRDIIKKAERDWTAEEKKRFMTLSLKYNLKVGG